MDSQAPIRPSWPTVLAAVFLLLAFGLAARLMILAPPVDDDLARSAERAKVYAELQAENTRKLSTYAWIDKDKGLVQIPIDRAIALTIPELNAVPPAPAGPIATPTPSP